MQKTPNKNLQDLFKTYVAKSGDEEKFRKGHVTTVVDNNDEKLGPKEDQFVATNKVYPRDASHHGYDVGGDERVYSEDYDLDEGWIDKGIGAGKWIADKVSDVLRRKPKAAPPGAPRLEAPGVAAARAGGTPPRTPGRDIVPISQRSDRSLTTVKPGMSPGKKAAIAGGVAAVGGAALVGNEIKKDIEQAPEVVAAKNPKAAPGGAPAAPKAAPGGAPAAPKAAPAAPRAAPSGSASTPAAPKAPPGADTYSKYVVGGQDVTGDVNDIAKANKLSNPNAIRAGQILKVGDSDYTVKRGDTLSGIAASRRAAAAAAPAPEAPKVDAPEAPKVDAPAAAPTPAPASDDHKHTPGYENKTPKQIRADARAAIRTQRVAAKVARLEKSRGADYAAAYGKRKAADIRGDVEKAYGHQPQASQAYGERAQHGRDLNIIRRSQRNAPARPVAPAPAAPAPAPAAPAPVMNLQQRRAASQIAEAMSAKDRYAHHHGHAKALLKSIADHLDREGKEAHSHKDFRGNKGPSWGHVGSMEHVAKQLGDIHDMLARQGEYAQSAKIAEEFDLEEKKLTPAEMKKREEVAQAIERDNPDMPMSKKMAIATAQAKKVAEEIELGESVMSDDAFDHLEKAGAEDIKTTSGGIHYKAGGREYKLRHDMKRSGHRTVRTAELKQHLGRLKALKESAEQADTLYLKEGSFKSKMLNKGYHSLQTMLDEDFEVDE